jgi:hypothetical protein
MGAVLGRLVGEGVQKEVATAALGLLVGWYFSRPGIQAERSRPTYAALTHSKKSESALQLGNDDDDDYFVLPETLDLRRQAQLVRLLCPPSYCPCTRWKPHHRWEPRRHTTWVPSGRVDMFLSSLGLPRWMGSFYFQDRAYAAYTCDVDAGGCGG